MYTYLSYIIVYIYTLTIRITCIYQICFEQNIFSLVTLRQLDFIEFLHLMRHLATWGDDPTKKKERNISQDQQILQDRLVNIIRV
jgi:hypothetical protein